MSTLTITGTGTDSTGAVAPYSITITLGSPFSVIATVDIMTSDTPVTRTLTVTASGGVAPYTYATPVAPGITFTPVAGHNNQWTFVF